MYEIVANYANNVLNQCLKNDTILWNLFVI